jgi:hypothetical protein
VDVFGGRRVIVFVVTRRRIRIGRTKRLPPVTALPANLRHVGAIAADGLATFATDLRHVLPVFADSCSAFAADARHVRPVTTDGFAAFAANARHVEPIAADGLSTFASRFASLLRRKLVSSTLDVSGFSPLAGDLSLPLLRHRGETAPRSFRHDAS